MTHLERADDSHRSTKHRASKFWWFVAMVALTAVVLVVILQVTGNQASMPYGAFLDQVEAGNVASVTLNGTEIDGQLKHPLGPASQSATQGVVFSTRAPDFGDPTLIPALRQQRVSIQVAAQSSWTWLLARLPWPMLLFLGAMIIVAFARFMRGGRLPSGSTSSSLAGHGIIGLVSGLIAKRSETTSASPHDDDKKKPN